MTSCFVNQQAPCRSRSSRRSRRTSAGWNIRRWTVTRSSGRRCSGRWGEGVGAFISAPADVVVTRLIEQRGATNNGTTNAEWDDLGPVDMARAIYAEGGVAAFFDGAGARAVLGSGDRPVPDGVLQVQALAPVRT